MTIIEKAGYEILEESISLYLGLNNRNGHYDVIRIIGFKEKSINTIEEYIKTDTKPKFGYKVFLTLNIFEEEIESKYSNEIDEKQLEKIVNEKLVNIKCELVHIKKIISTISKFVFSNYDQKMVDCLIEEDGYYQIVYDGYIETTEDLIRFIIKTLFEKKFDISKVSSFDDEINFDTVKSIRNFN